MDGEAEEALDRQRRGALPIDHRLLSPIAQNQISPRSTPMLAKIILEK